MRNSRERFRVRRIVVAVSVMAVLGMVFLGFGVKYLAEHSELAAHAKYRAIKPGMSRLEVRRLMQGAGTVMYTGIATSEIMHINGRYMIAVDYEPSAKLSSTTVNPAGPPEDDWVAKERVFLELGRGDQLDNLLVGLRLKRSRIIERDTIEGTEASPQ